jgi:dihydroxyacid dehydratase/phosphogluconate dehydratase
VHLIAMARRAGVNLTLQDMDSMGRKVPVLANLFPSGDGLMEDFHCAGGLPALMSRITEHLELDARNVNGKTLRDNLQGVQVLDEQIIRPTRNPVSAHEALAVLRGNLAPEGAVMKLSAADPKFFKHRGRALVFDDPASMNKACADPHLDCDESTVLILRNAGPVGAPGMPEWGNLPIPRKLIDRGVRDLLRLSDARMSGTHYGSCILHASPEASVGGPLALVQTGDVIELDVAARRLHLDVGDEELALRRCAWKPQPEPDARGYAKLYRAHVTQAHEGCDFDFLQGPSDGALSRAEPVIY